MSEGIFTPNAGVSPGAGVSDSPLYFDNLGTDIFHSHDADVSHDSLSYVKMKTITLGNLPDENLKIYYEMYSAGNDYFYSRIYRNGVPVGTENRANWVGGYGYIPFTETISGWKLGDTLEIWAKLTNFNIGGSIRNLRILGTIMNNVNS